MMALMMFVRTAEKLNIYLVVKMEMMMVVMKVVKMVAMLVALKVLKAAMRVGMIGGTDVCTDG
jgi:hypothetical protein